MESQRKNDILEILKRVKAHITDDSDVVWTDYDEAKDFRNDIDSWIERLQNDDETVIETIDFAFAPTSSFQEHAVSNGWGEEYLELAASMDRCTSKKNGGCSRKFLQYLNSYHRQSRIQNEELRKFFRSRGCLRMVAAMIVGSIAFFYPLIFLIDEWGYEGGLHGLFLYVFAPCLSYLFAVISMVIDAVLREIKPFRKFWVRLGPKALLLSLIPFVMMCFAGELGLQFEAASHYDKDKIVMTMTPGVPYLLQFLAVYPIVNFAGKNEFQ